MGCDAAAADDDNLKAAQMTKQSVQNAISDG